MNLRSTAVRFFAYLLFMVLGLAGLASAAEPVILVSDIDDTVKITNVLDRDRAIWKAIASEAVFAGMPELYSALLGPGTSAERLRFISGSPRLLGHKISELLNDAGFPAYKLTRRRFGESFNSAFEYKTKHMKDLYGSSRATFLLVGDDTESDPEVYANFSASKPGQVLAIYIHRISGRDLPPGCTSFITAYDIALHEFSAGRLREGQAMAVGEKVLGSSGGTFLPRFQECPTDFGTTLEQPQSLVDLQREIEQRLRDLCSSRASIAPSRRHADVQFKGGSGHSHAGSGVSVPAGLNAKPTA